ncbi:MAG: hypothetical protein Q8M01_07130 [Rubrivivax sp.]|nr:hypothetical protein [Rubrivivax sp.]
MNQRHIRPEDRCRSGGHGADPGGGADGADTVPACFRSEAFAEDLAQGDSCAEPLTRVRRPAVPFPPRRSGAWMPLFRLGLATAFGLRSTARD